MASNTSADTITGESTATATATATKSPTRYYYDTDCNPPRSVRTGIKTFLISPSLPAQIDRTIGEAVHGIHGIHNLFTLQYTFVRGELKVMLGGHNLPHSWGDGRAFRLIPALQLIDRSETSLENFLSGLRKIPENDNNSDSACACACAIPGTTLRIATGGTAAVELEAANLLSFGRFWGQAAKSSPGTGGWNKDTIILYDLEHGWIGTFVDLNKCYRCWGGRCCCYGNNINNHTINNHTINNYNHSSIRSIIGRGLPMHHNRNHHHREPPPPPPPTQRIFSPSQQNTMAYKLLCTLKKTLDETTRLADKAALASSALVLPQLVTSCTNRDDDNNNNNNKRDHKMAGQRGGNRKKSKHTTTTSTNKGESSPG
eukprot:CAMPEP_0172388472 /NCGR_PEP_ID=MMETSP1061-20121228/5575_1 /TAXON_ID=37318 /ORGANISM="Pseudo-nitzschia pungens, Strain cf. pungens" /LENGTH=371 /DNA_ID=CAMNT_0013118375 /DNA_START=67 /DNA_END=1182 /DNA_ORIENTATION=-